MNNRIFGILFALCAGDADAAMIRKNRSEVLITTQFRHGNYKVGEVELCRLEGAHKGDNPLSVRMLPDNKRVMYLTPENVEDLETETEIQCLGEAPSSCKQANGQCAPCPCQMDPKSTSDKYVQVMLEQIEPRCRAVPVGKEMRILLIGLGGGAAPQHIFAHCPDDTVTVHVVEIDKRVIQMARQYFGLPESRHLEVEHADASEALEQRFGMGRNISLRGKVSSTQLYDVVLVDCMAGSGIVPLPCRSAQFIELLHKALHKDGLVIHNIWHYSPSAPKKVKSDYMKTKAEYMRVFGNVDAKRVDLPPEIDWQDLLIAVA